MGHWTIKLGRQNGRLLHWSKCCYVSKKTNFRNFLFGQPFVYVSSYSLVFVLTQLHFGHWSSLPLLSAKFECPVACQNFSLLDTIPTGNIPFPTRSGSTQNVQYLYYLSKAIKEESLNGSQYLLFYFLELVAPVITLQSPNVIFVINKQE